MELESDQPSPEDIAVSREIGDKIKKALAALPPDQRLAVILRDIEGLDYQEIARVTGSSLGTVKSRINRGRGRLRHHLERYRELFP
jgi:RNA polymerase sigma-70 factor (ECF subfamily)